MIFVTVGLQAPFDRLVKTIEQWAGDNNRKDVMLQTCKGGYCPQDMDYFFSLPSKQFRSYLENADLVVSHAGMGTILTCLELAKPIIILPRDADFGETRNQHQKATAKKFSQYPNITVAETEKDLVSALNNFSGSPEATAISSDASDELIDFLGTYIRKNIRINQVFTE